MCLGMLSQILCCMLQTEHQDADLRTIQESTATIYMRLQHAIQKIQSQVPPVEIDSYFANAASLSSRICLTALHWDISDLLG